MSEILDRTIRKHLASAVESSREEERDDVKHVRHAGGAPRWGGE